MVAVKDRIQFSHQLAEFDVKTEDQAIAVEDLLVEVLDAVHNGNEDLRAFMEFLEYKLEQYTSANPVEQASGADVLRFLMDQHGHVQKDLAPLISRSTVSELLSGKREFTVPQMKKLGEFYNIDPAVFL